MSPDALPAEGERTEELPDPVPAPSAANFPGLIPSVWRKHIYTGGKPGIEGPVLAIADVVRSYSRDDQDFVNGA